MSAPLDDSDVGASATGKTPGPMPDFCALCGEVLPGCHDRMWELMTSAEGMVAAGNYCRSRKCERQAWRQIAEVVGYLHHRRTTEELWEGDKPDDGSDDA